MLCRGQWHMWRWRHLPGGTTKTTLSFIRESWEICSFFPHFHSCPPNLHSKQGVSFFPPHKLALKSFMFYQIMNDAWTLSSVLTFTISRGELCICWGGNFPIKMKKIRYKKKQSQLWNFERLWREGKCIRIKAARLNSKADLLGCDWFMITANAFVPIATSWQTRK